ESAQVAPGKVGSAYRAGEQLVAGEQDPLLFHEEAAVPRGVAGGVEHLEGDSGEGVALSIGQVDAFGRCPVVTRGNHPEEEAQLLFGGVGEEVVVGVNVGVGAGGLRHRAGTSDVVDVAV